MPDSPVLQGLHHVTAVTADARRNFTFYSDILGMRLVKKTVNQDDVPAYHVFYADALGQPDTELTFCEKLSLPLFLEGQRASIEAGLHLLNASGRGTM